MLPQFPRVDLAVTTVVSKQSYCVCKKHFNSSYVPVYADKSLLARQLPHFACQNLL